MILEGKAPERRIGIRETNYALPGLSHRAVETFDNTFQTKFFVDDADRTHEIWHDACISACY